MNRDEFIAAHPIVPELERMGVKLIGGGAERKAKCPFHDDKKPSFGVNVETQLWKCHANSGCGGGSVIDLISKHRNISPADLLRENSNGGRPYVPPPTPAPKPPTPSASPQGKPTIDRVYQYQDALGKNVYQVVRLLPKDFRQRHEGPDGKWIWNMEGVERVLYRLPEVLVSTTVAVCEGEKDADTATSLGLCGTCNVGGAGKWLDGYTESLAGKEVIIFGDNDQPGQDHVEMVFQSIAGLSTWVKIVPIPKTFKDLTQFTESFQDAETARLAINELIANCHPFIKGTKLPVYTPPEIEPRYETLVRRSEHESFDLGNWIPSLRRIRSLMPGELVTIVANTGVGKTACLSSIATAARPLPTLMFQLELPPELLFERLVASVTGMSCSEVEQAYRAGDSVGGTVLNHYFHHLLICTEPKLTPQDMERIIIQSELKTGARPKVVLVDYLQLCGATGRSRYERASNVAEELKVVAKSTRTIIIVSSQVGRPSFGDSPEVGLHDAKESGSIENSSGLVLGAWRDQADPTLLWLKVLKSTKGGSGLLVPCNFDGQRMIITERHFTNGTTNQHPQI